MSESVLRIVIDSRNAERNARNLSRELNSIEKNGDFATKSMDSMSVATRQLAGYMAGIVTVGAAISKMDTYTGINNKLKLVTTSQTELNIAMQDTFAIAQRSAASWGAVNDVYSKYLSNAKTLNLTQEQTAKLTEITSKAVSISGSSAESAASALFQYGQALDGGVLRAEEFNSLVDGAGGLLNAMAKGLNVTRGELRQMMLDGKLTGEVITQALLKAGDSVEELYGKTDFTIAQEMTRLTNEVTKFVGEAGKGSGAATVLGGSIRLLADNLDSIASIAMLGGVALLTKTIIAQTIATQAAITKSIERRASLSAEMASQVQLAAIEVQRTRQVAALALTEINLARQELNSAKTRNTRSAATMRLTQAEVALAIAQKQTTAATAAQTVAETALNAARSRSAMLLGLVGGPIGAITLGVTALAAGYMYMSNRTLEANAKLEEQAAIANKNAKELKSLEGVQLQGAKNDLAVAFEAQNKALKESNFLFNSRLIAIQNSNKGNNEIVEISNKVRTGVISQADAVKALNKLNFINPEQFKQLQDAANQYEINRQKAQHNADAQKVLGVEVKLMGNEASNAVAKINAKANATSGDAAASRDAAQANREYAASINNNIASNAFAVRLKQSKAFGDGEIDILTQIYNERRKNGEQNIVISADDVRLAKEGAKWQAAKSKAFEVATKTSAKTSKAMANQQKRDAKDSERLAEDQYNLRESTYYKYADRIMKIEKDLQKEIADIQKANFSPKDSAGYIENAKNRADLEKQLYVAQLTENVSAWNLSEERKLELKKTINDLMIQLDSDMNDDFKAQALQSMNDQHDHELALIELAKEERIFQMQQGLMHANDRSQKYWDLERDRIGKSTQDLAERNRQLAIANELQAEEKRSNLNNAVQQWGRTQADMTGTGEQFQLEQTKQDRFGESQGLFDAQMALAETAEQREAIWRAHHERMSAIEQDYHMASIQLQAGHAGNIVNSIAGMMKAMGGEQSKGYKVMYATSRLFTAANATLALIENISNASKIGFPFNIPMIAGAFAQGATIASMLSKESAPQGFATGGLITGAGTGTSDSIPIMASDKEFMVRAASVKSVGVNALEHINRYGELPQQTKRVGVGTLDAINSGNGLGGDVVVQPQININVPQGYTANQRQDSQGNVTIDVVKQEIAGAFNNIGRANSQESRAIQSAFGLSPAR